MEGCAAESGEAVDVTEVDFTGLRLLSVHWTAWLSHEADGVSPGGG